MKFARYLCHTCDTDQRVPITDSTIALTPTGLILDCIICGPVEAPLTHGEWRARLMFMGVRYLSPAAYRTLRGPDGVLRMPLDAGEVEATAELIHGCDDLYGAFLQEVEA